MPEPLIFSTRDSEYFARLIAGKIGIPKLSEIERKTFGGGERYYRISTDSRSGLMGRDVIFVASTSTDANLLEVYRIGCALAEYGVKRVIYAIPFMGYSTMERAVKPGEVVTAKTVAKQLSAITGGDKRNVFLMMDLHVSGFVHYFEGDCLRFELYAEEVLLDEMEKLNWCANPQETIFASADLGRPEWVKTFARKFGAGMAMIDKDRYGETTRVAEVIGDVKGKRVIIYDDMLRSGGSLINAAAAYLNHGASDVNAVISHLAINDGEAFHKIVTSFPGVILTTNSHPMSQNLGSSLSDRRIVVADVSGVFAKAILEILGS
ncbi:MAG: ribose-phosphate pyrophosphokinase [Candidatus Niyogibacteria bacterium]|nr:MAG: ribose-phosphate pyrophosphokinase [Candidatus Niyogibacteria bacterium]